MDSLTICYFCAIDPTFLVDTVSAATGRNFTVTEVLTTGKRIINLLRVFNLRHGLDISMEAPSPRYGSTPQDGPAAGKSSQAHWKWMKECYYESMGWDEQTGIPYPHTLKALRLEKLVEDL